MESGKKSNVIADKTYNFSIRIIKLYKHLVDKNKEYVLSKQVLRSGTSIGANVNEAVGAQSRKDFISKLQIAYKESLETQYWLRLLKDTEYIEVKLARSMLIDCEELLKILTSIIKSTRNNY